MNQLKTLKKLKDSLNEVQALNFIEQSDKNLLNKLLEQFPNLTSKEFSSIKGIRAQINLKAHTQPVFLRSRIQPFQIKSKVEDELDRMVQAGILKSVNTSRCAAPIVLVLKSDGSVRICGDFSVTVNPCILIDEHPLPTHEELFAKMSGLFFKNRS